MNTRILLASSIGGIILLGSACTQPSNGVHDYNPPSKQPIMTCNHETECIRLATQYPGYVIQFRPLASQETESTPPAPKVDTTPPDYSVQVVQEDDPRWDCHKMGNHRCGPNHFHPDGSFHANPND